MAEGESSDGGSWWGGDWGGWLQTAKEKSASAIEFVTKDLAEFTCVVHADTAKAADSLKTKIAHQNATSATQKVKDGVTSFLGGITKALVIEPDDADEVPIVYNGAQARLFAIQNDPATYSKEPEGAPEYYEEWLMTFVLEEHKAEISELLVANSKVRSLYTQMVPSSISHADFWQRYFYRLYQFEQDQARRAALMARAATAHEHLEQDLEWDDEDDWGDIAGPNISPPVTTNDDKTFPVTESPRTQKEDPRLHDPAAEPAALSVAQDARSEATGESSQLPTASSYVEHSDKTPVSSSDEPPSIPTEQTSVISAPPEQEQTVPVAEAEQPQMQTESRLAESVSSSSDMTPSDSLSEGTVKVEKSDVTEVEIQHANELASEIKNLKTREKGDLVMVGSNRTTPSSDTSATKESSSLDDDWEQEFDIEVTEDDIKMAQEAAKELAEGDGDEDDWENWD